MNIASHSVSIAGHQVAITIHRITTGRFGTFGLYYARNDYGEPRMSHDAYPSAREALEAEIAELRQMLCGAVLTGVRHP
jgi:hypothetical protein